MGGGFRMAAPSPTAASALRIGPSDPKIAHVTEGHRRAGGRDQRFWSQVSRIPVADLGDGNLLFSAPTRQGGLLHAPTVCLRLSYGGFWPRSRPEQRLPRYYPSITLVAAGASATTRHPPTGHIRSRFYARTAMSWSMHRLADALGERQHNIVPMPPPELLRVG